MYKDLSLKEKAKVIREGVRLGLNSIDDILNLYDEAISYLQGGPIVSPYGQWEYPGRDTIIPSNNITMDNVNYPVLGVSDTGDTKVMMPWNDYKFRGSMVYEHPLISNLALEGKKFNKKWKALDNILYNVYPDTTFTREKTGVGDIDIFDKTDSDTLTYPNGYSVINPYPGQNTIIYNPKVNDELDIRLDALHFMPLDEVYDALNTIYRYYASGDIYDDAKSKHDEDILKYGFEYMPLQRYMNNEADAKLRNHLIQGSREYIESKNYYPDKLQLRKDDYFLVPYIDEILKYLETGERPKYILPEVVITPNEYKKGGSIHIKPENRGKFTALKKRTGHSASWFKAHGTPALKKMAVFELNSRHWKHLDGGHLFLEDGWMNTNLLTLFDKYGPNSQVIQIDKPVRLNEVLVTADAPKPGDKNYDRYIANTYDAWKRGDVDINTLPTETRNRVRGYSGTIAALKGMNTAAKVAGVTTAVPLGIIGLSELASVGPMVESAASWLSSKPALYNLAKMTVGSEIGGKGVDLASSVVTGNSWGQNVGNVVEGVTGWNPNNYILGQIALDFTNPGYIGLEGTKSLGKSIAYGWNNKLNDLQFKYGVNRFVENTEYPTYQFDNLTNYRSNVKTRKVIDRVIKDNPSLSYEQKQLLRYAAKNMAYTNNVDSGFGAYLPINDRLDGSNLPGLFYPDNKTRLYQINVPKYDSWSNTHEIGHVVNDVEEGLFSSKHGIIPEYRYNSTDLLGNKNELFSDIFANMYSKRKPFDYLTFLKGNPWSLLNRVDATRNYIFDEGFLNVIGKTDRQIVKDPTKIEVKLLPLTTNNSKKIVHTLDEDDVNYSIKGLVSDLLEPTQSFRNMIRGEKMYKAMTKGKSLPYFVKGVDYESIPISDRTKLIFENYVMPRMKANHPEINEDNILQRLYNTPNYLVREDLFPLVTHTKNALAISNSNENVHSALYDQLTKSLQHTEPYTDSHELRHTLLRIVSPNKEELKILKKAYGSSGIKPTEFETMNLDGRTALFQKNKLRKKDGTFFEFDDIDLETQNKIIQNYPDKKFIETIYDSDGYWGYYIDDIIDKSGIDGPFDYVIDELLKTPEFKQTVLNWKDAMMKVGAISGVVAGVSNNKKSN